MFGFLPVTWEKGVEDSRRQGVKRVIWRSSLGDVAFTRNLMRGSQPMIFFSLCYPRILEPSNP
jgi:hypothetical protein